MGNEGCWIFLSHSSRDIEKVRLIRNEFEKNMHNPLAFHLKCLNTSTERGSKELIQLIKREIDAREWFVFCESKAAKESIYVNLERTYVQASRKRIFYIDLEQPIENILKEVQIISNALRIYVSYCIDDTELFERIASDFMDRDLVVTRGNEGTKTQYSEQFKNVRFHVCILTENSIKNEEIFSKIKWAGENGIYTIIYLFCSTISKNELKNELGKLDIKNKNYEIIEFYNRLKEKDIHYYGDLLVAIMNRYLHFERYNSNADAFYIEASMQENTNYQENFHLQMAEQIGRMTAVMDYCNIYQFPCCGKIVYGEKEPSVFRSDGCTRKSYVTNKDEVSGGRP